MVWMIRHLWTSSSCFTFNFYHHHTHLLVHVLYRTSAAILSCKGVTQGSPLAMVDYGLGFLNIIHHLQEAFTDALQTCYKDDAASGVQFYHIREFWDCLTDQGTVIGYFLEPIKYILATGKINLSQSRE